MGKSEGADGFATEEDHDDNPVFSGHPLRHAIVTLVFDQGRTIAMERASILGGNPII
jgi:hypothetical protein